MKNITYSSTSTFKKCRAKYDLFYNRKLEPIDRPIYFDIGTAYHKALEGHYKDKVITEIIVENNIYFKENKPEDNEKLEKWEEAESLVEYLILRYRREYATEKFKIVDTEIEFEVPIINPDTGKKSKLYNFCGVIDGLVIENGLYWIIEHKTTSQLNALYKKGLFLDTQSIAYIEAIERFMEIKIQGVLYNVTLKSVPHKPKMNKNGKLSIAQNQNTTYELFIKAIKEHDLNEGDYSEFLGYLETKNKEFFYREYLVFPKEVIQEWRYELWQIAKDMRQAELEKRWYKNTSQCVLMGTCPCFDICTAIDKESVIEGCFQVRESANSELKKEAVNPF